jgi:hypothetical protein
MHLILQTLSEKHNFLSYYQKKEGPLPCCAAANKVMEFATNTGQNNIVHHLAEKNVENNDLKLSSGR